MKNFFKHPIVVSVISALIIGAIVTPVVAYVKSQSFWEAIKSISSFILSIFRYGVPLWIIVLALIVFSLLKRAIKKIDTSNEIHFTKYRKDVIDDIEWEWDWVHTGSGYAFRSQTPVPYCRRCKGNLVVDNNMYQGMKLMCENCGYEKQVNQNDFSDYHDRVKREIHRRIRTDEWKPKENAGV